MNIENTDLERRVLAHEQILQALMAHLAAEQPNFLDRVQERFASVRPGAYDRDDIETADYAEAFLGEVARLGRTRGAAGAGVATPAGSSSSRPPPEDDSTLIHSARSGGVWHVTRNGAFLGDYLSEAPARREAARAAREIEQGGGRAEVLFGPDL
jgi:hypothetical protein